MPIDSFNVLCSRISDKVGEIVFHGESYLIENGLWNNGVVPLIASKAKVIISLCMLAGGSYMDLVLLFNVSRSRLYIMFDNFLQWVLIRF